MQHSIQPLVNSHSNIAVSSAIMVRVFIILLLSAISACSMANAPQSWRFVQSVGGIAIGEPFYGENGWVLPVNGDVSGLRTITVQATAMNSGIACQETVVKIDENKILLTIKTYLGAEGRVAQCPPAFLGRLPAGKYGVFYHGPNEALVQIGEVSIGR